MKHQKPRCAPGCTCRRHGCEPGCTCGKHRIPKCPPDCTCAKHQKAAVSTETAEAISRSLQGNQNSRRHGESTKTYRTPENTAWQNMRARCRRPSHPRWKDYGGRGITIDPRWDLFVNFLADMGRRPGPGYSIERRDNDGPYSPDNCYWATVAEQAANKRRTC